MSRAATVLGFVVAGGFVGAVLSAAAVGLAIELGRRLAVRAVCWGPR